MPRLHRISVVAALVAAVALSTAFVSNARGSAHISVPRNLCTLTPTNQLKAIGVTPACKPAKTAHVGPLTIYGANWGTVNDSVGLQVYAGIPHSRFSQQFAHLGSPVPFGVGGREAAGATGVIVSGWVGGVGVVLNFNHPGGTNAAYRTRMLALAQAIAKGV